VIEVRCQCGVAVTGEDEAGLLQPMRGHVETAHAELRLTDQQLRDYIAAALRSGPARPRVEHVGTVEVRPLTPDRLEDYLRFFDRDAFADNPAWADCFCMFYMRNWAEGEWQARAAAENRADMSHLIACGQAQGYLAYVDGEPAGWVNAAPRSLLPAIDANGEFRVDEEERVGAIACFVVAPHYRGHGIARRLLDAAIDGFRRQGLRYAEGYPARDAGTAAAAFHGPYAMYEEAGFRPVRELERQTVMRRDLTALSDSQPGPATSAND
jgi:GNAT superfamily N-acetyltransferase